jgi:hypothetical protein
MPVGRSNLGIRLERETEGAKVTMLINDKPAGTVQIPGRIQVGGGLDIGRDPFSPVTRDYDAPFPFSGKIHRVVLDILDMPVPVSPTSKPKVSSGPSWRRIAK